MLVKDDEACAGISHVRMLLDRIILGDALCAEWKQIPSLLHDEPIGKLASHMCVSKCTSLNERKTTTAKLLGSICFLQLTCNLELWI